MYTTLNKIKAHNPCKNGWKKLLKNLNKTTADDEPLAILAILDSNGLDDALWCFRAVDGHEATMRSFAKWCALQNIEKIKPYCSLEDYTLILAYLNSDITTATADAADAAWAAWSAAVDAEKAADAAADAADTAWAAFTAEEAARTAEEAARAAAFTAAAIAWVAAEAAARAAAEAAEDKYAAESKQEEKLRELLKGEKMSYTSEDLKDKSFEEQIKIIEGAIEGAKK